LLRFAADLMALNETEEGFGSGIGKLHHPVAKCAEIALDIVGIRLEAGIDMPAIAARGAEARLLRFQQQNIDAALGQMQCGGEAGDAAANDHDRGPCLPLKPRQIKRGNGCFCVETRWQRLFGMCRHKAHRMRVEALP
jgi:hypothetical protein